MNFGVDKMNDIIRKEIADGVFFNSVSDSRFKTMRITANIITPLSAQTASENALLCGILSRSCKAYPDFTALSRKLAFLYGADINTSVSKGGDRFWAFPPRDLTTATRLTAKAFPRSCLSFCAALFLNPISAENPLSKKRSSRKDASFLTLSTANSTKRGYMPTVR